MAKSQNEEISLRTNGSKANGGKGDQNFEVIGRGGPSGETNNVSKRIQTLKNNKKAAKSRLTRVKNQLAEI